MSWLETAPALKRALRFRCWAAFFMGTGYLAFSEQLGAWIGFHLLPPGTIALGSLVLWLLSWGMANAAVRAWNVERVSQLVAVLQRQPDEERRRGQ